MFNNLNTEDLIKSIRGLQMTGKEQQLHYSQGKNSGTLSCAFILQTKHHNLKNKYFKQESIDAFSPGISLSFNLCNRTQDFAQTARCFC